MSERIEHRISFPLVVAEVPSPGYPDQYRDFCSRILKQVRPTRMRLNIMSALTTGWLPWGVKFWEANETPEITLCGREYILCCGHVLREKVAQQFTDAGLLTAGQRDKFDRPTLVITPAGREWLTAGWWRVR